jgi:hypothetical protein
MTFRDRMTAFKNGCSKVMKSIGDFMTTQEERDRRLMEAVEKGDAEKVARAIANKANVNKLTWSYDGPLPKAIEKGDTKILALLLEAKADPNRKYGYHDITPFWLALRKGDMQIIHMMLDAGADVNAPGDRKMSAYAYAVARKNKPLAEALLARGAAVDVQDKDGWTPLFYAARNGDDATARFLLDRGARTYLKDAEGNSVLDVAEHYEKFSTRRIIQAHIDAKVPQWQKTGDQEIAHVSILRDQGYRLTTAFNMESKTCTVIAHNYATGRDAVTVKSFDELNNPALLKTATEKLAGMQKPAAEQQNTPQPAQKPVPASKPGK